MGASYYPDNGKNSEPWIYDALLGGTSPLPQSFPIVQPQDITRLAPAVLHLKEPPVEKLPEGLALRLVQDRADIDISGPEFNFVRSIRVFDVRYARQRESGPDDDCTRNATVILGTYGIQGDFSWADSSVGALPEAHTGLERWGDNCPSISHRSVFVDWRDYEGNYGFEQVNY